MEVHFEYEKEFRTCKHCGHRLALKNSMFKMSEHLRKHSTLPQPPPKVHLCPECGESFTVSFIQPGGLLWGLGNGGT